MNRFVMLPFVAHIYAKGETKVKFDSDKLTAEDILKIVKQTGYDAVLVNK